ncbi:unnamed protein product [Medioppia subpectinata]|uniref:Carboxylic ester hydrolase n=1 Tax=Medioppia subpectinata TaxID=1979941 RepID=A0A7R9KGU9_9ACAR|nr:unnamed protein product [Medioppia subpectinata]CAG2103295.1 unnamed protein product [Medioppia subpectinata]
MDERNPNLKEFPRSDLMVILLFGIIIYVSGVEVTHDKSGDTVSVRIGNGVIDGRRESYEDKDLDVYLGIPYAQPPVGLLRFKRPLPVVDKWTEPLNAQHWSPACYHVKLHNNFFNPNMSEDCLYLNIWSPAANPSAPDTLRPVMFWIHGGGLVWGSAVEKFYSGHVLSALGDVVVVTFNYRLNIFGTLYTGAEGPAPGNQALWDQALALEWVHDNIKYFGGDPDMVTVFGESAGAVTTALLTLSPVSRHLFRRAIVMSGTPLNSRLVADKHELESRWVSAAVKLGCDAGDSESTGRFTPQLTDCLLGQSADRLITVQTVLSEAEAGLMSVIVDGELLPSAPDVMLRNGDYKKGLDLMIGTTEDEGSMILLMARPDRYDKWAPKPLTRDELVGDFKQFMTLVTPGGLPNNADDIVKFYFNGHSDDTDSLRHRVGVGLGDVLLGCPTILYAKAVHSADPTARVYQYYYNIKAGDEKFLCAHWAGVCHFSDVYPVFGLPLIDEHKYVERERQVSRQMIAILSTFARTGSPPAQSGAQWEPYYSIDGQTIGPYYEFTNEPKVGTNFGQNLKHIECEVLWKKHLIN